MTFTFNSLIGENPMKLRIGCLMLLSFSLLAALLSLSSVGFAQLSIVNPKHLDIPDEMASVLLNTACQVVAEEFHQHDASELQFRMVLVLGDEEEHYTVEEKKRVYTLYLKQWDEDKFATLAMRLCVQRLATSSHETRLVKEILRRTEKITPISTRDLKNRARPVLIPPVRNDCDSAVREQRCQDGQPPH